MWEITKEDIIKLLLFHIWTQLIQLMTNIIVIIIIGSFMIIIIIIYFDK